MSAYTICSPALSEDSKHYTTDTQRQTYVYVPVTISCFPRFSAYTLTLLELLIIWLLPILILYHIPYYLYSQ